MLTVDIPNYRNYAFQHLVLDMNGTLSTDGMVASSTMDRLATLARMLTVHVITSDTFGTAQKKFHTTEIQVIILSGRAALQKKAFVDKIGAPETIAIGNGNNDIAMLEAAGLGICIINREGAACKALLSADIVVNHIDDALDLLLRNDRLIATLRG